MGLQLDPDLQLLLQCTEPLLWNRNPAVSNNCRRPAASVLMRAVVCRSGRTISGAGNV